MEVAVEERTLWSRLRIRKALVAIDLGPRELCASPSYDGTKEFRRIHLIHRFSNAPIQTDRGLCWNIEKIIDEVKSD